jgi:hypothetical protein
MAAAATAAAAAAGAAASADTALAANGKRKPVTEKVLFAFASIEISGDGDYGYLRWIGDCDSDSCPRAEQVLLDLIDGELQENKRWHGCSRVPIVDDAKTTKKKTKKCDKECVCHDTRFSIHIAAFSTEEDRSAAMEASSFVVSALGDHDRQKHTDIDYVQFKLIKRDVQNAAKKQKAT